MEDKDLQIENGNYTRIVNKVIDELVNTPLLGAEYAICLFVIRKTYGFNKKEDQISLSQFEKGTGRSRPTVMKALKNLKLVNILQLVKVGESKTSSSVWRFNKYYGTWKLVKPSKLVKDRTPTSKEKLLQLVKTPKHTKDNTKDNIQKKGLALSAPTPKENAEKFFLGVLDLVNGKEVEWLKDLLSKLLEKNNKVSKRALWEEIKTFCAYWTELNQTGTRQRWQMQKTFQVDLRLATWFKRAGFGGFSAQNFSHKSKGKNIIGLN